MFAALLSVTVYIMVCGCIGKTASIFGYSVLKVVSGSMEPSIHEGDYIYIKRTDTDSLKAGDIISFYSQDDSIKGEINTHRISEVLSDGTFVTKGDANKIEDSVTVQKVSIIGKYYGKLRFFKWLGSFASTKKLLILFVIIPTVCMAVYEVKTIAKIKIYSSREEALKAAEEEKEKLSGSDDMFLASLEQPAKKETAVTAISGPEPKPHKVTVEEINKAISEIPLPEEPEEQSGEAFKFIDAQSFTKKKPVSVIVEEKEPEKPKPVVVGELFKTYVVAQVGDEMILMDKHAAHERYIFERIKSDAEQLETQMFLEPIMVLLSYDEYDALTANLDKVSQLGFEIEPDVAPTVAVKGVPIILGDDNPADIISELAKNFIENKLNPQIELFDDLYHSIACKAAIKANDTNSGIELQALVNAGTVVITVGGGGIPVVRKDGKLYGTPAVIDKDFASAKLAELLDADMLVILTAVEKVAINFGKPDQKGLDDLTPADARKYIEEKQFAPGSMLPKVQAALSFAESKPGRVALITLLEKAADGISGKTGTRVHQ